MSEITEIAAKARSLSRNTHDGISIEEYLLRHLPALSSAAVADRGPDSDRSFLLRNAVTRVSELEAENARLKAELDCALIRECNEKHHAKISHQNMNAEINARERTEARLAEAMKALDGLLEPFEGDDCRYDHHGYCQAHFLQEGDECCVKIARRVREGGKADG